MAHNQKLEKENQWSWCVKKLGLGCALSTYPKPHDNPLFPFLITCHEALRPSNGHLHKNYVPAHKVDKSV